MKTIKFLAIVAMCSMTLAAAAATTAKAKIVIAATDNSTDVDNLYILEGDTYSDAFDDGKDAIKIMNDGANAINLYAVLGGNNLQMCYTNDISNLPLTFASGSATDYTMTFSNITGTVKLYDAVTGTETVLANSGTYNFNCAANTTIADRFFINYVPSAPKICHRYGALQVYGSKDMTVKVLNMDGTATSIADTNITTNSEVEIPLAGLAAGQYKVEWNSQTLIIDVK